MISLMWFGYFYLSQFTTGVLINQYTYKIKNFNILTISMFILKIYILKIVRFFIIHPYKISFLFDPKDLGRFDKLSHKLFSLLCSLLTTLNNLFYLIPNSDYQYVIEENLESNDSNFKNECFLFFNDKGKGKAIEGSLTPSDEEIQPGFNNNDTNDDIFNDDEKEISDILEALRISKDSYLKESNQPSAGEGSNTAIGSSSTPGDGLNSSGEIAGSTVKSSNSQSTSGDLNKQSINLETVLNHHSLKKLLLLIKERNETKEKLSEYYKMVTDYLNKGQEKSNELKQRTMAILEFYPDDSEYPMEQDESEMDTNDSEYPMEQDESENMFGNSDPDYDETTDPFSEFNSDYNKALAQKANYCNSSAEYYLDKCKDLQKREDELSKLIEEILLKIFKSGSGSNNFAGNTTQLFLDLQDLFTSLPLNQILTLMNVLTEDLILNSLFSIIVLIFGDCLIKYLKKKTKSQILAKFIKYRTKLQKFFFMVHILIIIGAIVLKIFFWCYLMFY